MLLVTSKPDNSKTRKPPLIINCSLDNNALWYANLTCVARVSGAHLGFSEGGRPNFRKEANQYKMKRNEYKSYIGDNILIISSYKIKYTYDRR